MECPYCHEHDHSVHCSHPMEVYKCNTNFRTDPMASTPICRFKLGVLNQNQKNGAKVFYLSPEGQMCEFVPTTKLLSPATSGLFMLEETDQHKIIKYASNSPVRFSFYVALYDGLSWRVQLRGVYTRNGIQFFTSPEKTLYELKNLNTALVLALMPNGNYLKIQCIPKNVNQQSVIAEWRNGEWSIVQQDINVSDENVIGPICNNCGRSNHQDCDWPSYHKTCSNCLVVSMDGDDHSNPCNKINKISPARENILCNDAMCLFDLKYSSSEVQGFFMNDGSSVKLPHNP